MFYQGIGKICKPYHIEISENAIPRIESVGNKPFALLDELKILLNDFPKSQIITLMVLRNGSIQC